MRQSFVLRSAIAFAAIFPLVAAHAQNRPTSPVVEQSGAVANPDTKKVLQFEDFARWNRITSPAVSADGKWMTFTYSPNEGGQTILHVKALDGGKDYTAVVGGGAGGGRAGGGGGRGGGGGANTPPFTDDSKWAAYLVTPATRGRAGNAGGGRGGRGRGAPASPGDETQSTVAHLELLNLGTGEKVAIPSAASWKFSADSRWLAAKLARATPAPATDANAGNGRGGRGGGGGGGAELEAPI